jgi:neurofibromin 1
MLKMVDKLTEHNDWCNICVLQCNCTAESAELFVNCLEAMVETCLPVEEGELELAQYPSMLSVSSNMNLSSSMSSLTLGSPTEKG